MLRQFLPVILFLFVITQANLSLANNAPESPSSDPRSTEVTDTSMRTAWDGPRAVIGEIDSRYMIENLYQEPTVVLFDMSRIISGHPEEFIPESGQILGYFTEPLYPGPGKYRIHLPVAPSGNSLDLDNKGRADAGVQVFRVQVSANIIGNSYVQQLEQVYTRTSGNLEAGGSLTGSFLVYAPDDRQSFPSEAGADQKWFTEDDPSLPLQQGYTKITITDAGKAVTDRSAEVELNIIQASGTVIPDFSGQGILESYHSLLDLLSERYAYTAYRNLDWEAIRGKFLPSVKRADSAENFSEYYLVLDSLALSIEDAHVSATAKGNIDAGKFKSEISMQLYGAGIGATAVQLWPDGDENLADNPVVVLTVGENSPAAGAGWKPGTEILTVNGVSAVQRLQELPLPIATGVKEVQQVSKGLSFFDFAPGQEVSFTYRQPGETRIRETTLTAGTYDKGLPDAGERKVPIHLEMRGNYTILQWSDFVSYVLVKIAVLEEAISIAKNNSSAGMVIDLRGNLGGFLELYETMASYFFSAEEPMRKNINDEFLYNPDKGDFEKLFSTEYYLSAPNPELAYSGPLYILVDQGCQSACEYFSDHLQRLGRAKIIGQYNSIGAGGTVTPVILPGGLGFNYTWGRTLIAGTDTPNLEAKGVKPDIRVPVTLETELAKLNGGDPVLDSALTILDRESNPYVRLSATRWKLVTEMSLADKIETSIDQPEAYTLTFEKEGNLVVNADCNQAQGDYTVGEYYSMAVTLGPSTMAMCPEGSQSESFLQKVAGAVGYSFSEGNLVIAVSTGGQTYGLAFEPMEE